MQCTHTQTGKGRSGDECEVTQRDSNTRHASHHKTQSSSVRALFMRLGRTNERTEESAVFFGVKCCRRFVDGCVKSKRVTDGKINVGWKRKRNAKKKWEKSRKKISIIVAVCWWLAAAVAQHFVDKCVRKRIERIENTLRGERKRKRKSLFDFPSSAFHLLIFLSVIFFFFSLFVHSLPLCRILFVELRTRRTLDTQRHRISFDLFSVFFSSFRVFFGLSWINLNVDGSRWKIHFTEPHFSCDFLVRICFRPSPAPTRRQRRIRIRIYSFFSFRRLVFNVCRTFGVAPRLSDFDYTFVSFYIYFMCLRVRAAHFFPGYAHLSLHFGRFYSTFGG